MILAFQVNIILFAFIVNITPTVLILEKPPKLSDLIRIFLPYAHQYYIIGSALEVDVSDLLILPIRADQKLIHVFERWIALDNETTWEKILVTCQDYPDKFGRVMSEVKRYLLTERARKRYLK